MEKATGKILEKDLTLAESKTKEMNNELTSDGTCPQCIQNNQQHTFYENRTMGYWECPNCNLKLQMLSPNFLGIMNERGEGNLKSIRYDKDLWGDRVLLRKPLFNGDDCVIEDLNELNEYLAGF